MNILEFTQLLNYDGICQYTGMSIDENGGIKNILINIDATINVPDTCQAIEVAPLMQGQGTYENVTITGQIQINSENSQLQVSASKFFGYQYLNLQTENIASSLTYKLNEQTQQTTYCFVIGDQECKTISEPSQDLKQLTELTKINVNGNEQSVKYIEQSEISAEDSQIQNYYINSYNTVKQIISQAKNCQQVVQYSYTLYSCQNVTFYLDNEYFKQCTDSYLNLQTKQCVSTCTTYQWNKVCSKSSCPKDNLYTIQLGQSMSCVSQCPYHLGYYQDNQKCKQAATGNYIYNGNVISSCDKYIYGRECVSICPYGYKLQEQQCIIDKVYCNQNNLYYIEFQAGFTYCDDKCPKMLIAKTIELEGQTYQQCSVPGDYNQYLDQQCDNAKANYPILTENEITYCTDICTNNTAKSEIDGQQVCDNVCADFQISIPISGQCQYCSENEFYDRATIQCVGECQYQNITTIDEQSRKICELAPGETEYCTLGEMIEGSNYKCVSQCQPNHFIQYYICNSECQDDYYIDEKGEQCIEACQSLAIQLYNNQEGKYQCLSNNQKQVQCAIPNSVQYEFKQNHQLCQKCNQGEKLAQNNNNFVCTNDTCQTNYVKTIDNVQVCFTTGGHKDCMYLTATSCADSCTAGTLADSNYQCTTKEYCDEGSFQSGTQCVKSCPSKYFYIEKSQNEQQQDKRICRTNCDSTMAKGYTLSSGDRQCETSCELINPEYSGYYIERATQTCIQSCQYINANTLQQICEIDLSLNRDEQYCPIIKQIDESNKYYCYTSCPQGQFIVNSQCSDTCSYYIMDADSQVCANNCNIGYYYTVIVVNTQQIKQCLDECDESYYYADDPQVDGILYRCEKNCSLFTTAKYGYEGQCQESCPEDNPVSMNNVCGQQCSGQKLQVTTNKQGSNVTYVCTQCPDNVKPENITINDYQFQQCKDCLEGDIPTYPVLPNKEFCSPTCEGLYYKANDQIVQCISDTFNCSTYFYGNLYPEYKLESNKQCVQNCTQGEYIFTNSQTNTCVQSCENDQFVIQNNEYICKGCTPYFYQVQLGKQCTDCKQEQEYVHQENECKLESCLQSETLKYYIVENGIKICQEQACQSSDYKIIVDKNTQQCGSKCNSVINGLAEENGNYYCTDKCPSTAQYYQKGVMIAGQNYSEAYQCVESCNNYYSTLHVTLQLLMCVTKDECSTPYKTGTVVINNENKIRCESLCSNLQQGLNYASSVISTQQELTDAHVCIQQCESGIKFLNNDVCQQDCSSKAVTELGNDHPSGATYQCYDQCSSYYTLLQDKDDTSIQYHKCVDQCTEPTKYATQERQCIESCQGEYKFENNGICVKSCPKFVSLNNVCQETTKSYYTLNGIKYAVSSCNNISIDGQNYDAPYIEKINGELQECRTTCSQQYYNVQNNSKICTTGCSKYYIPQSDNQKQCISSCTEVFVGKLCYQGTCDGLSKAYQDYSQYKYTQGQECKEKCDYYLESKQSTTCTLTAESCNTSNAYVMINSNRICVENCRQETEKYISYYVNDQYNNVGKCVQQCPNEFTDLSGEYIYHDIASDAESSPLCSSGCSTRLFKEQTQGKVCQSGCSYVIPSKNQNYLCVDNCEQSQVYLQLTLIIGEDEIKPKQCQDGCQQNQYINNKECVSNCSTLSYYQLQNQNKVCLSDCTTYYISGDAPMLCVEGCEQVIGTITDGNQCKSDCGEHFLEDGKCVEECTRYEDTAYYKVTENFKICMQECDDFDGTGSYTDYTPIDDYTAECKSYCEKEYPYVDELGQCVSSCPTQQYLQDIQCVSSCDPSKYQFYQRKWWSLKWQQICQTSCRSINMYYEQTTKGLQCVSCNTYFKINQSEYECLATCDKYTIETTLFNKQAVQCVDSCPSQTIYGSQCVSIQETCQSLGYDFYEMIEDQTKCLSSCLESQSNTYRKSQQSYECIQGCESNQYTILYYSVVTCTNNCDEMIYDEETKTCVDSCFYTIQQNKRICTQSKTSCDEGNVMIYHQENQTTECITQCNQYIQDNYCVDKCISQTYQVNEQNQKICQDSCQNYYIVSGSLTQCIDNCEQSQFLKQNNSKQCVSTCYGEAYIIESEKKICIDSIEDCEYIEQDANNLYICKNTCPVGNYKQNRECVSQCDYGYYINGSQCVVYCESNRYQLQNNSGYTVKTCIDKCDPQDGSFLQIVNKQYQCVQSICTGVTTTIYTGEIFCDSQSIQTLVDYCTSTQFITVQGTSCTNKCEPNIYNNDTKQCLVSQQSCNMYIMNQSDGSQMCISQCKNYLQIQQGYTYCAKSCESSQYILQNKTCTTACTPKIYDQNKNCVQKQEMCKYYMYNEQDIVCMDSCQTKYTDKNQCTDTCDYVIYQFKCKDQCENPEIYYSQQQQVCQTNCPTSFTYYQITSYGKLCTTSCGNYYLQEEESSQRQCIQSCPEQYFVQGLQCVEQCSQGYFIDQNVQCVSSCQQNYVIQEQGQLYCATNSQCYFIDKQEQLGNSTNYNLCVDQCQEDQFLSEGIYCVGSCDNNQYIANINIKQCVSSCKQTEFISSDNLRCLSSCPETQFKLISTTVSRCQEQCSVVADTEQMMCYDSVNSCMFVEYEEDVLPKYCKTQCTYKAYETLANGILNCVQSCPQTFYVSNEQFQCVADCGTVYTYKYNETHKACITSCTQGDMLAFQQDMTCVTQCPDGYQPFNSNCVVMVKDGDDGWINIVIGLICAFVVVLIVAIVLVSITRKKRHQKEMKERAQNNRNKQIESNKKMTSKELKQLELAERKRRNKQMNIKKIQSSSSTASSRSSSTQVSRSSTRSKVSTKSNKSKASAASKSGKKKNVVL